MAFRTSDGLRTHASQRVRIATLAGASIALGTAAALMVPSAVTAAPLVSQATGRLINTSAFSMPLPVELLGATAVNTGGATVVDDTPLNVTAVNHLLTLMAGPHNLFAPTGVIQFGAVGQYASASPDGSSFGFSGAVSAAPSLIGVNPGDVTAGDDVGTPGGSATAEINVGDDPLFLSTELSALAASAKQDPAGNQVGDYSLADISMMVDGTIVGNPLAAIRNTIGATIVLILATPGLPGGLHPREPDPRQRRHRSVHQRLRSVLTRWRYQRPTTRHRPD